MARQSTSFLAIPSNEFLTKYFEMFTVTTGLFDGSPLSGSKSESVEVKTPAQTVTVVDTAHKYLSGHFFYFEHLLQKCLKFM